MLSQCTLLTDGQTDGQTDRRTDRQTDRQTEFPSLYRDCIPCSAVKMMSDIHATYIKKTLYGLPPVLASSFRGVKKM